MKIIDAIRHAMMAFPPKMKRPAVPAWVMLSLVLIGGLWLTACSGSAPAAKTFGDSSAPANPPAGDVTATPAAPADNSSNPAGSGSKTMLADLGFRADKDGFAFENYGTGYTNLTEEDMNKIFGDAVCANKTDGKCTLIPPAQQWMEQTNNAMSGGHCYGFAVASLNIFQKTQNPADLGAATASALKLDGNVPLQRQLAKDWSGQKFDAVRAGAFGGDPNTVIDKLVESLKSPGGEKYVFGFFKRDGNGGHAVTPYAVEDRGSGIWAVLLYDNNYPGVQREMIIDRNANTWKYEASINPSVKSEIYEGDATTKSLLLFPITPASGQQPCPFCAPATSGRVNGLADAARTYNQIWLDGPANLLISDKAGHHLGYFNGKLVNEIPGAYFEEILSDTYNAQIEPTYYVPTDIEFTISVDGTALKEKAETNVVVIGPGYDLGVERISLDPGQKDEMSVSPQDNTVSYKTTSSESPTFIIGLQRAGADYEFEVKGAAMEGGGTINVYVDPKKGDLVVNAEEVKKDAKVSIVMTRIGDKTEEIFENDEVSLKAGDLLYVDYAEWKGNNTPLTMTIMDAKGTVIDQFQSVDQK